jgi:hypothetical protein
MDSDLLPRLARVMINAGVDDPPLSRLSFEIKNLTNI